MTSPAGRILGNYELGEAIGRGGASEVFAGVHRFLGHEVAVKLLRAGAGGSSDAFLDEAARARAVHHPNLVAVLDFGRDEESGRCYLVMERIPGESLAERIQRGRLAEPEVRALGAALADAMQAAHDGDIVHRDLKPANVMLRGDQPTVVDFGLARDLGGQSAVETGRRVGTPAYMAPEQLTGGLIAPCVDVWALGVILFESLTGKLPFDGYADGRCPQLFETAPRASSLAPVSAELDALVAACLEREPGRRPPSMAAVAAALRGEGSERITQDVGPAVLVDAPVVAEPRRWRPWLVGAAAVAAALAAAIAVSAVEGRGGAATSAVDTPSEPPVEESAPLAAPTPAPAAPAPVPAIAPAAIEVELRSTPPGADVLVDGKRRGRTPAHLSLPGPARVVLRKRGFQPAAVRVERAGLVDVRLSRRARAPAGRERPRPTGEGLD